MWKLQIRPELVAAGRPGRPGLGQLFAHLAGKMGQILLFNVDKVVVRGDIGLIGRQVGGRRGGKTDFIQ